MKSSYLTYNIMPMEGGDLFPNKQKGTKTSLMSIKDKITTIISIFRKR